jgi:hypothetical protein
MTAYTGMLGDSIGPRNSLISDSIYFTFFPWPLDGLISKSLLPR